MSTCNRLGLGTLGSRHQCLKISSDIDAMIILKNIKHHEQKKEKERNVGDVR